MSAAPTPGVVQAVEPDWLMLKAGQEALFDYLPEWTIDEREELAGEVFAAMLANHHEPQAGKGEQSDV